MSAIWDFGTKRRLEGNRFALDTRGGWTQEYHTLLYVYHFDAFLLLFYFPSSTLLYSI
ncbi:hypothetical protein V8C42DRAFT_314769 [Trichoderma barbatum]